MDDLREQFRSHFAVDQQRFRRAANRNPAKLCVADNIDRHRRVGSGMNVAVANAFEVAEDRDTPLPADPFDQGLAAPRDDEVDRPVEPRKQHAHGFPVGRRDNLHCVRIEGGVIQPPDQRGMDRNGASLGFRSRAKDHRIAGPEANGRGVRGNVRPGLVDHSDNPDRRPDSRDVEAVGPHPAIHLHAHRVRQFGDLLERCGN